MRQRTVVLRRDETKIQRTVNTKWIWSQIFVKTGYQYDKNYGYIRMYLSDFEKNGIRELKSIGFAPTEISVEKYEYHENLKGKLFTWESENPQVLFTINMKPGSVTPVYNSQKPGEVLYHRVELKLEIVPKGGVNNPYKRPKKDNSWEKNRIW